MIILNDINDLSVFSRNWLWTKAQGRTAQDIEIMPTEFEAEILGNQIIIELPEGITAGRFEIGNLKIFMTLIQIKNKDILF